MRTIEPKQMFYNHFYSWLVLWFGGSLNFLIYHIPPFGVMIFLDFLCDLGTRRRMMNFYLVTDIEKRHNLVNFNGQILDFIKERKLNASFLNLTQVVV